MKNITLCADDYGQDSAVSQAIIVLAKQKKISAISCLTSTPQWLAHAGWLAAVESTIDLGVHFNLTQGKPLSSAFITAEGDKFPSLPSLLKKSYLKQLDPAAVLAELHAQLDQFQAGTGRPPDFIDGHQHIHQFPIIRELILSLYNGRLRQHNCYIRCAYNANTWLRVTDNGYLKRAIIQLCGASAFKKLLIQNTIPYNASFSGIYIFSHAKRYPHFFLQFLQQSLDKGLIMCHPGLSASAPGDELNFSRQIEYNYFQSKEFTEACQTNKINIVRFNK